MKHGYLRTLLTQNSHHRIIHALEKTAEYIVYTPDIHTAEDGGGVMLLIKDNLNPTPLLPGKTDAEIVRVTISSHPNIQWQVGVCDWPEEYQAHMLQKRNNSINTIENSNCLLLGDFNFRKIDWGGKQPTREKFH